jgi:hypothetical protein
VIGVFTTTRYDSRRDFDAGRSSGVHVTRNHFTEVGVKWMWEMMAGHLRSDDGTLSDHLGSARIVVGNGDLSYVANQERLQGDQTAQAALDGGFPTISTQLLDEPDDLSRPIGGITFRATFGEADACFDWREQGVVSAQGVLIDRAVGDGGRKVLGSVWVAEATLELSG